MDNFIYHIAIILFSLFSFIIGCIYTNIKSKKLNKRIDRELHGFNVQLKLLNNSVYGNFKNECKDSTEERLAQLELNINKHSDLLNDHMNAINKLARHTEYPKSNYLI